MQALCTEQSALSAEHFLNDADIVVQTFDAVFQYRWNIRLVSGADEPLYLPSGQSETQVNATLGEREYHRIFFRHDYFSSALHEAAHWCLAGDARRKRVDYGYWYEPDGRNAEQQKRFEQVEARPQALEWLFTAACGKTFQVSIDNLGGTPVDTYPFRLGVWQALQQYGQPNEFLFGERATLFIAALQKAFGVEPWRNLDAFVLGDLQ